MPQLMRRGCVALSAFAIVCLVPGCNREAESAPASPASRPIAIRADYLRHLALTATVKGNPVRVIALYANAPDYRPTGSPARDGFEGIASVDDAARAAVAYLRRYEATGDTNVRDEALGLLGFVTSMQQGDGEFVNFIDAGGRPNTRAPSSVKSMSYWGARSIWALGEAVRVLGADSAVTALRPTLDRALTRMARDINPGHLLGGSVTATSEALLGVLALGRSTATEDYLPGAVGGPAGSRGLYSDVSGLATRTAELLARQSRGDGTTAPWGAYVDAPDAEWHAWGSRSVEALATAAHVLNRPDFAVAARKEADGLWSRFMMAGQVPATVSRAGDVKWFPQIAYGVGPIVEGYLALANATGDRRYAIYAGLAASWFMGNNVARVSMYDERVGRTFDGIDGPFPVKVNRNAGAESNIEAVLALDRISRDPDAAEYARYRAVDPPTFSLTDLPATRSFVAPGGETLVVRRGTSGLEIAPRAEQTAETQVAGATPITLTYWPAANPIEVRVAEQLATQWNAENPGVQVRVQPLPAGRSTEEVLLAAIVAKSTPDVSSNVSSALLARLVRAKGVVRLDNRTATAARLAERASPAMLASLRLPDGGIYAFPWKTNPEMLMYNVDLFKAAGLSPPRTHTELLAAFRRLTRDADGDGRLDHWGLWAPLKTTWFERFYDFYPLYLASSGGKTLIDHGKIVFDNDAAAAALGVLRQGFADGTLPRSNFALGRDPFADGTVAMKIIGPWFVREMDEMKVKDLRYDVTPMPVADGVDPRNRFAFADMRSIAIFSTSRHPDAAARFVAFLTSPEADRMLIEVASQLPYRRGLVSDPRFTRSLARWPTLAKYAEYVERTRDIDIDPDVVEIFDLLSEAYEESAVYGTVPVRQALTRAAAEARKVVSAR
jgi:multiple sugar transport system substrate-binding protein